MAEQIIWVDGKPNVARNVEKICPGRHITQSQWRAEWKEHYVTPDDRYSYDYISDYECIFNHPLAGQGKDESRWQNLQEAKRQGTRITITNVASYTRPEAAQQIVNSNGFTGKMKKINENEEARFTWWTPLFTSDDITNVRNHLGEVIQPFIGENDTQQALKNQFASSDAFRPNVWRYGNRLFQYRIKDLCQYYQNQVGELRYKILGTFSYKVEVMHAILVCSQANGAGRFAAYPGVLTPVEDVKNEAIITLDVLGNWIWRPQATATEITRLKNCQQNYPKYRRWEHLAFAFHIPDEWGKNGMMMVENPGEHQLEIRY